MIEGFGGAVEAYVESDQPAVAAAPAGAPPDVAMTAPEETPKSQEDKTQFGTADPAQPDSGTAPEETPKPKEDNTESGAATTIESRPREESTKIPVTTPP